MSTNPPGAYQSLGTAHGGIVLNGDSDACPGCGRPLSMHGTTFESPGGRAMLSPCGLDVSGVPLEQLLDAIGRTDPQSTPMSSETKQTTTETHRPRHTDLSTFKIDTLIVTARLEAGLGQVKGLAIKDGLEEIRDESVNHGRLYPNLDELAERGLVEKERNAIDARTNSYRVTQQGFRVLQQRRDHLSFAIDGGV